jgi:hypothetical protein
VIAASGSTLAVVQPQFRPVLERSRRVANAEEDVMRAQMKVSLLAAALVVGASGYAMAGPKGGGQGGGYGGGGYGHADAPLGRGGGPATMGNYGPGPSAIGAGRGANAAGFCPPGQRKKLGQGSRFRC